MLYAAVQILGPNASQADVYAVAVSDVVADVLRGYNGTILAYGQTGERGFSSNVACPVKLGLCSGRDASSVARRQTLYSGKQCR